MNGIHNVPDKLNNQTFISLSLQPIKIQKKKRKKKKKALMEKVKAAEQTSLLSSNQIQPLITQLFSTE